MVTMSHNFNSLHMSVMDAVGVWGMRNTLSFLGGVQNNFRVKFSNLVLSDYI